MGCATASHNFEAQPMRHAVSRVAKYEAFGAIDCTRGRDFLIMGISCGNRRSSEPGADRASLGSHGQRVDDLRELIGAGRLHQVIIEARLPYLAAILVLAITGEGDQGHPRKLR